MTLSEIRENVFVAHGRTGLLVYDAQPRCQPGLVREHQRLAGIG